MVPIHEKLQHHLQLQSEVKLFAMWTHDQRPGYVGHPVCVVTPGIALFKGINHGGHHQYSVKQNVQSTQNVQQTKHVSIRNVWILVQEFVELMLHVQCRITIHPVHVIQDTQEILSDTAQELQHCQFLLKLLIHADHLHVVQMLFAMKGTEQRPANVFQTTLVILM